MNDTRRSAQLTELQKRIARRPLAKLTREDLTILTCTRPFFSKEIAEVQAYFRGPRTADAFDRLSDQWVREMVLDIQQAARLSGNVAELAR